MNLMIQVFGLQQKLTLPFKINVEGKYFILIRK